jgi:hypothetical protein
MDIKCKRKTCHDEYEILEDISYETPDKTSHKSVFDLYLPRCGADLRDRAVPPVAVFVHGGGWRRGDKDTWKHFVFEDVNFLVAFVYWYFGLYGNVGREFARRGVPCAVISYPLTKLKLPWLFLELATSHLGCVIFLGVLFCFVMCAVILIYFLTHIDLTSILISHEHHTYTGSGLFLGHLVLVNLVTLVVITAQRSKHKLNALLVGSLWIVILGLLCAASRFEHSLFTLWFSSFVLVQGTLLYLNLKSKNNTHEDQITALSKCIKKVRELGRDTAYYDYNSIYLIGHSAGGHLCSLLALRQDTLEDVGVESSNIKVVIFLYYSIGYITITCV